MANVTFLVKTITENPDKKVSIRVRFREGKTDQSVATGESVQLKHWDVSKQNLKRSSFKGKDAIKAQMKKIESHVLEVSENVRVYEKGWLRNVVDKFLHPSTYPRKTDLTMFQWIENWISKSNNHPSTISGYRRTLDDLKKFKPNLTWSQIDFEFYDEFIYFLTEQGLSQNTIGGRVKNLKVFCNTAYERKVNIHDTFRSFKKPSEDVFNVYLDEEELEALRKIDLSNKPYLDRTRDFFLIGCWTGCRYSDLGKVFQHDYHDKFIRIEQKKTKKRVVIPIFPVVEEIVKKYEGIPPDIISNQKFNTYIKEVCKLVGFKNKITKGITKGGKRLTESKEKWKLVSSHTARRSFATNLYKNGFPTLSIMALTGHKTEKSFLNYIKVNEEEHAELLLEQWNKKFGEK